MSVRRLAPKELQPASFSFSDENLAWAKAQIAKYPPGRQASAVIAIMWRVQEQHEGWVSEAAIRAVADLLEMPNAGAACGMVRAEFEQYLDERARLEVVAMEPLVEYIEDGE